MSSYGHRALNTLRKGIAVNMNDAKPRLSVSLGLLVTCLILGRVAGADPAHPAAEITWAEIPAGGFVMGNDATPLWDQKPAHPVKITQAFRISVTEITVEQYRRFRPEAALANQEALACGVSWHDAVAYCEWLSRVEGRPYRLPTEAEWEYVRRSADGWGVQNMGNDVREWCQDWFGDYAAGEAVDPIGAASGLARVVRGGVLDMLDGKFECVPRSEYEQASYRAGLPPAFGIQEDRGSGAGDENADRPGYHRIGFRVVQGALPGTTPTPALPTFLQQGVKQSCSGAHVGPDLAKPYFRKRALLPSPPETVTRREDMAKQQQLNDGVGLDPSFRGHNHSPALEVCDNGDLLLVIFTAYTEYEPEMSLMAARLRFGADQWDMPVRLIDCAGACDNTPLLWNDHGRIHLFWAWSRLAAGAYPFQWISSEDHGATWSDARFPKFTGAIGPHSRQPINRAFRGLDGTIYVPSDAVGGSSVLWASRDNMATWVDTGGRSAGRHTAYGTLKDGRLLGMGGKNTDIEGYMPRAISADGGATWAVSKTVFPALAANQRPSLLRLQSGRLFFASDFQKNGGGRPAESAESGSFVALSDDDGETWKMRKLVGAQPHENGPGFFGNLEGATTLGYSVARQAPNGVIHLITTMNRPCLHFELNEAWILSEASRDASEAAITANTAHSIHAEQEFVERYADGTPRLCWHAGVGDDGRYLLHGTETWFRPDGTKQYEARYQLGCPVETETLWRPDGGKQWEWTRPPDGTAMWTQWWENGQKKAESTWRQSVAVGVARTWDRTGKLVSEITLPPL